MDTSSIIHAPAHPAAGGTLGAGEAGCCSSAEQAACCAPAEKAACCGDPVPAGGTGCGCR